jgi:hypothetical protein
MHDVLASLLWLHRHRHDPLLSAAEFDRQDNSAWKEAGELVEEHARRKSAPDREPLDRADLARCLADAIQDCIFGEGGLVAFAREIRNGDPNARLPEETPKTVGEILWSETSAGDMAHAARTCGVISGYSDLASWLDVELPEETKALLEWGDTIDPV